MNRQPIAPWQAELADAFSTPEELLAFVETQLSPDCLSEPASRSFPFRVTRSYARRIRKSDPEDPLLRQVLPVMDELSPHPGFGTNPVGDLEAVAVPGLLHKYRGRALLIVTAACAIHCRYCFRRNFPYRELGLSKEREKSALAYIAGDTSISEVILSGGDPLLLDDERLGRLLRKIAGIAHVRRLRIHSRLPIVLPSRITETLVRHLTATGMPTLVVAHANHAREIDEDVGAAVARLRRASITVLNQSVLLKGVNDSIEALVALSHALFDHGLLPYYLHLLDRSAGTAHFEVDLGRALQLFTGLRRELPGYLVPRLARDAAGLPYKALLGADAHGLLE